MVILNEECSVVVNNDMSKKLKKPRSFNVSCFIGDLSFDKALANLGASNNFMPLYLFKD